MTSKISVNIVCGPLGSGKTSLVKQLLTQRPKNENWALLVNEFGSVGIDGAIFKETDHVKITQMPGGCICCSAKSDLTDAITDLLANQKPERIIIEPTGLGEPEAIIDVFKLPEFKKQFDVQTVFSVLDSAYATVNELQRLTIMKSLLTMADVVVLNKQDLATDQQINDLYEYCLNIYPPKHLILKTKQSYIEPGLLNISHQFVSGFTPANSSASPLIQTGHAAHAHEAIVTELPYQPSNEALTGVTQRLYKKQLGVESIGWIFDDMVEFQWAKVQDLFKSFDTSETNQIMLENALKQPGLVRRAKAVLRIGKPWMLFQYVNNNTTREYIAYRKDSRLELLIKADSNFDFLAFEQQLADCQK